MKLRTLGTAGAFRDDGSRVEGLTPESKRFAVLLRVVLFGSCRRDELAALLWPELDQEHARGALRQVLRVLRKAIGSNVLLNRGDEEIALAPGSIWCDAVELENALATGRASDAWELYRGEFLDAVYVSGVSTEFTDWMSAHRLKLRRSASRAAWLLADQATSAGDIPRSTEFARRACQLAGDSETDIARLLSHLSSTGDRAGALAEYEQFARHLEGEYDATPSPQTQKLIADIRTDRISASTTASARSVDSLAVRADSATQPTAHAIAEAAPQWQQHETPVPDDARPVRRRWRPVYVLACAMLALVIAALLSRREHRTALAATVPPIDATPRAVKRAAADLVTRAEYYLGTRSPANARRARDLFEDAIDRDPTMTRAYVGLAYVYGLFAHGGWMQSHQAFQLSAAAASKALELDSTSAMAIAQLAAFKAFDGWRWSEAEPGYRRAIQLEPGNPDIHVLYGTYLRVLGRYGEAANEFRRAHELAPLVRHFANQEARVLLCAGQNEAALALLRPAMSLGERSSSTHEIAADAFAALSRYDDALREWQQAALIDGDSAHATAIAQLHGRSGNDRLRFTRAQADRKDMQSRAVREWVSPTERAASYARVGDWQNAYAWLDSALTARDVTLTKIGCDRTWDGVRAEARFQRIAETVGVSAGIVPRAVQGPALRR